MFDRRNFLRMGMKAGLMSATAPIWASSLAQTVFAQTPGSYKALIMVSLPGGNDGNNMVIPLDQDMYTTYAGTRPTLALPATSCIPLTSASGTPSYGLHPAMANVAKLFNSGNASIVANVGPLSHPVTKAQLLANPSLLPAQIFSHSAGQLQWATSSATADASSGWGGRLGDQLMSQSGQLPPIFNASNATVFTVGQQVQAISVQAHTVQYVTLADGMNDAILQMARNDKGSNNLLVSQAAQLRERAMVQQVLIQQAQKFGQSLQTSFPNTPLGDSFKSIVQLMKGRSIVGATRQIFYCEQDATYDTHANQLFLHNVQLSELDTALGALMQGLQEIGLADSVLICTSSDFNRTMQANSTTGTDHAWGNHQLVLGGIRGSRIVGSFPDLDLGGPNDLSTDGIWIPTQSVTQLAAGIGAWLGLPSGQLNSVFPDLVNFPTGPLSL